MFVGREDSGELVFIYGTLRRRASESARMTGTKLMATWTVKGSLHQIAFFPALSGGGESTGRVTGELYRIPSDQLMELDRLHAGEDGTREGGSYTRERETVSGLFIQHKATAWVWRWTGPMEGAVLVSSGDWLDVEHPRTWPLFTCVGAVALASPPSLMVLVQNEYAKAGHPDFIPSPLGYIIALGAVSPFVGCAACCLAMRRREKWPRFRLGVLFLLILLCVPGAFILAFALGEVTNWF